MLRDDWYRVKVFETLSDHIVYDGNQLSHAWMLGDHRAI